MFWISFWFTILVLSLLLNVVVFAPCKQLVF
jgi:hypothetical protein